MSHRNYDDTKRTDSQGLARQAMIDATKPKTEAPYKNINPTTITGGPIQKQDAGDTAAKQDLKI